MNKKITTFKDLYNLIEKYNLQDKKIILGVQGYNTQNNELYEEYIFLKKIKNNYIICDSCGLYYEELKEGKKNE